MFSDQVMDHVLIRRNVGPLPDATYVGCVGIPCDGRARQDSTQEDFVSSRTTIAVNHPAVHMGRAVPGAQSPGRGCGKLSNF